MSTCTPAVTVDASATVIEVAAGAPTVVVGSGDPITLVLQQTAVTVEAPGSPALLIEVCKQGPAGPPGQDADNVCNIKPDATLSYTGNKLTRVDYVDGRYKDLTYSGSRLIQVDCVDPSIPETARKTLTYTGNRLTGVSTVVL